ncbi:MAG: SGNH/GDSL hydrolase family protein [Aeromicrobium sp.]
MITTWMAAHRSVLVAFVIALVVGPFVAWQGAQGDQTRGVSTLAPQGIVVIGDSITARYNDTPGDADQGWWSVTARRFDADVRTYAQSGSGYLRPGRRCGGDRFIDRSPAFTGDAPSIVLVEGGRNDWAKCVDGVFVPSSDAELRHAVDTYLDVLQTYLPAETRIIVLGPPWGPLDRAEGRRVTAIIEDEARAHGLEFISTAGSLTTDRVVDGVHPNRNGSLAIARRVIRALER